MAAYSLYSLPVSKFAKTISRNAIEYVVMYFFFSDLWLVFQCCIRMFSQFKRSSAQSSSKIECYGKRSF